MSIIGVDIGGTKIKAGLVINGEVTRTIKQDTHPKLPKKAVLSNLMDLINYLFDKDVEAICLGVPGIPDPKTGVVYEAYNIPAWRKVKIKEFLEKRYNVPVFVNNDANCFTLGEKLYGIGKEYNNIVGLTLGTGLGGGIIINGKIYCGKTCGGSEFGGVPYLDGELEDYCSAKFFEKSKKTGPELSKLARKGNRKAVKIFKDYGHHLGKAIATIANILDPDIIILGGSVAKDFRFFKKSMKKSLEESMRYKRTLKATKVVVSKLENPAILGAAALSENKYCCI